MPEIPIREAAERLAKVVEKAEPSDLVDYYAELFPRKPQSNPVPESEFAKYILNGIEPEEIVSLWNLVFPRDLNVWYNEETDKIHFSQKMVGY